MEPRKSFCATSVQVNNPEGIQAQASLDEFFKEWKQDLHASAETVDAEIEGQSHLMKSPAFDDVDVKEILPLFVLPCPQSCSRTTEMTETTQQCLKTRSCNLVDTLISDLDEISSIPFFDIELPWEIALIIFSHLSLRDLCVCSQVSQSWKALADDNVLWLKISQKYSFQLYTSGLSMVWRIMDRSDGVPIKWLSSDHLQLSCCAANSHWGAVGTSDGRIHVVDVATCAEVDCLVEAGSVRRIDVAQDEENRVLASQVVQTRIDDSTVHKVTVFSQADGSWDRLLLARETRPVQQMKLLKMPNIGVCLLYCTSNTLTVHPVKSVPTHILSPSANVGYISCCDHCSTRVACGTSTFGYKVQVYDLISTSMMFTCSSHSQRVSCVTIFQGSPELIASGSADKCVRVYDSRASTLPIVKLCGHGSPVSCVQMDEWKVVSGSLNGSLIVWDQRMNTELWRSHERHPVSLCSFSRDTLVACFEPSDKYPVVDSDNPFIYHRRHRGLVRLYDFSVDTSRYTNAIPTICTSGFDEPSASFYNIDLKYPYDTITN
ncbi:F-box/WD repeat-containing protein 8-like isoform X2 [Halichondria panicea]|uniref:F-box/WD repeat-containing protein 8-like isoform X2 n=1 Tax=Halichondria panicea TaxID=6063 RepID=UPI00312B7B07